MEIKQTKKELFWEIFRFLLVGGTATIVDYFVFWIFDGLLFPLLHRHTSQDTVVECGDDLVATLQRRADESTERTTVFLSDDHVVRHVYESACEVSGISGLHGRIGQTLTGTV